MIFTIPQFFFLLVLLYFFCFSIVNRICKCIEHCHTSTSFNKMIENGKKLSAMVEDAEGINNDQSLDWTLLSKLPAFWSYYGSYTKGKPLDTRLCINCAKLDAPYSECAPCIAYGKPNWVPKSAIANFRFDTIIYCSHKDICKHVFDAVMEEIKNGTK